MSLSPNASARLRPQMLARRAAWEKRCPEAVIGGAGAWHAFLLRRRNVPLTGERVEVLRLHVPQT